MPPPKYSVEPVPPAGSGPLVLPQKSNVTRNFPVKLAVVAAVIAWMVVFAFAASRRPMVVFPPFGEGGMPRAE